LSFCAYTPPQLYSNLPNIDIVVFNLYNIL
jgi:hypothetical protein